MLKKEILKFLIIGLLGTSVDYLVYLYTKDLVGIIFAKGFSFICGSIIAFILNKIWTFKSKDNLHPELFKFTILYISTLIVNISINSMVLSILNKQFFIAFIIATGVHTILNFLGQKFWVFRR